MKQFSQGTFCNDTDHLCKHWTKVELGSAPVFLLRALMVSKVNCSCDSPVWSSGSSFWPLSTNAPSRRVYGNMQSRMWQDRHVRCSQASHDFAGRCEMQWHGANGMCYCVCSMHTASVAGLS